MKTNIHFLSYLAQFYTQGEMLQTKVVKKIKTPILFSITFLKNTIYEMMWKNTEEPGKPQVTIWCICTTCWIPKATYTCSEHVILIAFPLQQHLRERASMLHYTYTVCLVIVYLL
jgi:hypothetical protein